MDAEQVVEKILSDAAARAGEIKKLTEEKQAGEKAELAGQLDEYEKQTEELARKRAEDEKSHLLAAARMEIAKAFLAEKRKILDEVFVMAGRQLQNLPDKDYRGLMTKLMLEAVETGDEEIIIDRNETRIDKKLVKEINGKLGPEYKNGLSLSDQRQNLTAGFILKRGRIKNSVSLEVLLTEARKELEIELAKELFS